MILLKLARAPGVCPAPSWLRLPAAGRWAKSHGGTMARTAPVPSSFPAAGSPWLTLSWRLGRAHGDPAFPFWSSKPDKVRHELAFTTLYENRYTVYRPAFGTR